MRLVIITNVSPRLKIANGAICRKIVKPFLIVRKFFVRSAKKRHSTIYPKTVAYRLKNLENPVALFFIIIVPFQSASAYCNISFALRNSLRSKRLVIFPSCITYTASHSRCNSGISDDIIITAIPFSARFSIT